MRERGLARAREFSWGRSIRRVKEIYDEVLAG
jgi:glycosyltransferase involved in cell wall biosynthesis